MGLNFYFLIFRRISTTAITFAVICRHLPSFAGELPSFYPETSGKHPANIRQTFGKQPAAIREIFGQPLFMIHSSLLHGLVSIQECIHETVFAGGIWNHIES